jgi:uncharacterized protein (DUF1697 family)
MPAYVALLRAVNLGPTTQVAMAELKTLMTGLGLGAVRTLLRSGNAVFEAETPDTAALERKIEAAVTARFGVRTEVYVRSTSEWAAAIAANPLPKTAASDPGHLLLIALKAEPAPDAATRLQARIVGPEIVRTVGRHAYVAYPAGIGRSKLTAARLEAGLGTTGTARNWNTVLKLDAMLREA